MFNKSAILYSNYCLCLSEAQHITTTKERQICIDKKCHLITDRRLCSETLCHDARTRRRHVAA